MVVVHQTTAALVLVILTLILQGAGMAFLIQWVKSPIKGYSPIWNSAFHHFHNPAHEPDCLLAYADYSAVGLLLSLELYCHLGIGRLLLRGQLFDSRRLGPCSPSSVANAVPDRKYRRRPYAWPLCRFSLCDCN